MLLDRVWDEYKDSVFITKDQFVDALKDWTITPIESGGEVVGAFWVKGSEIHLTTFGKWHTSRQQWRGWLMPIIRQHGCCTTKVARDNARVLRIVKRVGWVQTGEDEFYIHFTMRNFRYAKL